MADECQENVIQRQNLMPVDQVRTIGGSLAAAVVGESPYTTRYKAWEKVTYREVPERLDAAKEWGHRLEPVVLQKLQDMLNQGHENSPTIKLTGQQVRLTSRSYPHAHATVDALIEGVEVAAGEDGITLLDSDFSTVVEAKTSDDWPWDAPPRHYFLQAQHNMACAGRDPENGTIAGACLMPVLFRGRYFRLYVIPRDQACIDWLMAEEAKFWRAHVLMDEPPAPEAEEDARQMWPISWKASETQAGEAQKADHARAVLIQEKISQLEGELSAIKARLMCAMGNVERLADGCRLLATWKQSGKGRTFKLYGG